MSTEIDIEDAGIVTVEAEDIPAAAIIPFCDPAQTGPFKLRRTTWGRLDAHFAKPGEVARWFAAITGKVGGAATDIDAMPTTGAGAVVGAGMVFFARTGVGGSINLWYVRAGTDAQDVDGGIIRPLDYDGATNQIIIELMQ